MKARLVGQNNTFQNLVTSIFNGRRRRKILQLNTNILTFSFLYFEEIPCFALVSICFFLCQTQRRHSVFVFFHFFDNIVVIFVIFDLD